MDDYQDQLAAADAHRVAGRRKKAALAYQQVLQASPEEPAALLGMSELLIELHRRDEAIRYAERAAAAAPDGARYHLHLCLLLHERGDKQPALDAAQRALDAEPRNVQAHCQVAMSLSRVGRHDEAEAQVRAGRAIAPMDLELQIVEAEIIAARGDHARAIASFEALAGSTWNSVSLRRIEYGLAVSLDKLKRYDEAFAAYTRSNEHRAKSPEGRAVDGRAYLSQVAAYDRDLDPSAWTRWDRDAFIGTGETSPVFVVGFPRSGTTMTEQILAAHPDVETSGERPFFQIVTSRISRQIPGDESRMAQIGRLTREQVIDLRQAYWDNVAQLMGEDLRGRVVIDKLPLNLVQMGIVNTVFPEAKVVMILRDPRDVCLSCFKQRFRMNNAMANFLDWQQTGETYAAVMNFWLKLRPMLSLDVLDIRYEDLTADLKREGRRLLKHIGLPWNDAIMSFHEQARSQAISTPSDVAVGQAINTRAIGKWARHAAAIAEIDTHIGPLVKMLGYE